MYTGCIPEEIMMIIFDIADITGTCTYASFVLKIHNIHKLSMINKFWYNLLNIYTLKIICEQIVELKALDIYVNRMYDIWHSMACGWSYADEVTPIAVTAHPKYNKDSHASCLNELQEIFNCSLDESVVKINIFKVNSGVNKINNLLNIINKIIVSMYK